MKKEHAPEAGLSMNRQVLKRLRLLCLAGALALSVGVGITAASAFTTAEELIEEGIQLLSTPSLFGLNTVVDTLEILKTRGLAEANFYDSLKLLDPSGIEVNSLGCDQQGICEYTNAHVVNRERVIEGKLVCPMDRIRACRPVP